MKRFIAACVGAVILAVAAYMCVAIAFRPQVILEGHSQIAGTYNSLPSLITRAVSPWAGVSNVSTSGQRLTEMLAQVPRQIAPLVAGTRGPVVIFLMGDGTNDYYLDGATGEEVYGLTCEYADAVQALSSNVRFIACTTPHRSWKGSPEYAPDPPDINARIDAGNALILANADGKFDGVVDHGFIVSKLGGPDVFTSDGIHLTQAAAEAVAPHDVAAIRRAFRFPARLSRPSSYSQAGMNRRHSRGSGAGF